MLCASSAQSVFRDRRNRRFAASGLHAAAEVFFGVTMKTILLKGAMLASGLALSACAANEPTFGQRLQTQSVDMAQIGGDWSEGADEVAEGGRLIALGRNPPPAGVGA